MKQEYLFFPEQTILNIEDNTTFKTIIDLWMLSKKNTVKKSTYSRYFHLVSKHILPCLGDLTMTQINTQTIRMYIDFLLNQGRLDHQGGLSMKTTSDICVIVQSIIQYANDYGANITCSFQNTGIKKVKKQEIKVLSNYEQKHLTEFLMEDIDNCKLGVLLSLYTGIRIGELCALKWEDLSIDEGILIIRKCLQRIQLPDGSAEKRTEVVIQEPKSLCSKRIIPIPSFLLSILSKMKKDNHSYFLTGIESAYMEPRVMQNKFKSYINACGIADINYHALRHTFATRCMEIGFDVKSLSEILGHANVNITLNRYVHSSLELKTAHMNKLSSIVKLYT